MPEQSLNARREEALTSSPIRVQGVDQLQDATDPQKYDDDTSVDSSTVDRKAANGIQGEATSPDRRTTCFLRYKEDVNRLYTSDRVQIGVALLIGFNFMQSACEAQFQPTKGTVAADFFALMELLFNIAFLVELLANQYANWFVEFWKSSWNVFDFVVVFFAWLSALPGMDGLPGFSVLRLFRAFRVFRLFKRIEPLRIIMIGIADSLPGVGNAFMLLFIIMGIWSIMGVSFFGDVFQDEFGHFGKAMLTMAQLTTFDSWVSAISRPVCLYFNDAPYTFLYFVSYAFMSSVIMMNVVVAILVNAFIDSSTKVKEEQEAEKAAERARQEALAEEMRIEEEARRAEAELSSAHKLQRAWRRHQVRRRSCGTDEDDKRMSLADLVKDISKKPEQLRPGVLTHIERIETLTAQWQLDTSSRVDLLMARLGVQPPPSKGLDAPTQCLSRGANTVEVPSKTAPRDAGCLSPGCHPGRSPPGLASPSKQSASELVGYASV